THTAEMPASESKAGKGVFLSRGIGMKQPWRVGGLPGWFHFANLKVRHGRRAWWLRVEDPKTWAAAISSANDQRSSDSAGGSGAGVRDQGVRRRPQGPGRLRVEVMAAKPR